MKRHLLASSAGVFFSVFFNGLPVLGLGHGSQGARSRGQQRDPEEGKNRVACGGAIHSHSTTINVVCDL